VVRNRQGGFCAGLSRLNSGLRAQPMRDERGPSGRGSSGEIPASVDWEVATAEETASHVLRGEKLLIDAF